MDHPEKVYRYLDSLVGMWFVVFCKSLGSTGTSRTTFSQWEQRVQGTYALAPGGSTAANFLEPSRTTSMWESNVCRGYRMSSGWFDYAELSLTMSSQGNQGL